jgi:PPM family protein phosphatase
MKVAVGAATDVGRVREGNEDSYFADAPVFAVADGMGGHLAGDVASATAVDVIKRHAAGSDMEDSEKLAAMLREANREIWDKAASDPALRGMGTTCTLVLLEDSHAQFAHVGDSRAYLFHDGELQQVTEDHTLVGRLVREGKLRPEEAERHPQRSIITRALGVDEDVEVDVFSLDLEDGDRLILCSDGLSSMIGAPTIGEVLGREEDPQAAAQALVDHANEAGGEDNITVVVIDIGREGSAAAPIAEHQSDLGPRVHTDPAADTGYHRVVEPPVKPRRRWPRTVLITLVVLLAVAAGGFFAARYALDNSWFIGVNDEELVTIYSGIPDEVLGFSLREEETVSSIELEALPSFQREEVVAGIKVDSLSEAERTLDDLERLASDKDFQSSTKRVQGAAKRNQY